MKILIKYIVAKFLLLLLSNQICAMDFLQAYKFAVKNKSEGRVDSVILSALVRNT